MDTAPGQLAAALILALSLATVVGLVALWPGDEPAAPAPELGFSVGAEVTGITTDGCQRFGELDCEIVRFTLTSGDRDGEKSFLVLPPSNLGPRLSPGDRIRVQRNPAGGGIESSPEEDERPSSAPVKPYAFVDFERKDTLAIYAIAFVLFVLIVMRIRGLRALFALGAACLIATQFVVAAILDGSPPLAAALVGGVAILLVTMLLSHGLSLTSAAATLGTTAALVLAALLALGAVELAHVTGLASPEAGLLQGAAEGRLSFQGLILAGMVIGVLGVLDDVTVSQSSTVLALRRANPLLRGRALYRAALSVGRDHAGATINTLVLAYVGAALPLLLIFSQQGTPFSEAINSEPVATEVLAMLVGSIAIVAAVPLTTAIAASLAGPLPEHALAHEGEHGHSH